MWINENKAAQRWFDRCVSNGQRTFNANLCVILNIAEFWRCDTRVCGRLAYVSQLQDVLADRHTVLRRQLDCSKPPLDARHWRPDGHAREVDCAAGRHLRAFRQNGEMRRYATNCGAYRQNKPRIGYQNISYPKPFVTILNKSAWTAGISTAALQSCNIHRSTFLAQLAGEHGRTELCVKQRHYIPGLVYQRAAGIIK